MISILLPVYNAEKYIRRCIDSILAQTYKDFELVVLDDGSSDGSGVICDEYAGHDARMRVIHTPNGGVGAARNRLVEAAKGEYIGFVDSDDYIEPNMFEILYNNLIEYDADVSLCGTRFVFSKTVQSNASDRGERRLFSPKEAVYKLIDNWTITCSPCDKLYKANMLEEIRFPEVTAFEDMLTVYRVLSNSSRIVYDDQLLYNYIKTPGSLLRNKFYTGHLTEIDARREMTEQIGSAYPEFIPKLEMNELKTKLYVCNRIIAESPEMRETYDRLSDEIKAGYKKIMRSQYAGRKVKIMATVMKTSDGLYRLCVRLWKNGMHRGIMKP